MQMMRDNSNNAQGMAASLLLWHILSIAAICLSPILFSGAPIWHLEGSKLHLYLLVAGAYLVSAAISSLYAYRVGSWRAVASLVIGLAPLGIVFLAMLVTRMTYARSVLLQLFMLATILNLGPLAFRLIPRLAKVGLAAATAAMLLLSIAGKGDLLRSQSPEFETRRVLTTNLYNVVMTEYHGRIPWSGTKGGGVTRFGDDVLLATAEGQLFVLQFSSGSEALRVRELALEVPLNKDEFLSGTHESIDERRFRVGDVLVQNLGDGLRIFASHHYWNVAESCFTIRVSSMTVDRDASPLQDTFEPWKTVFESTPCLGVLEAKSGNQPEYPKFAGHQMGGRLALLDDQSLLLTVGDHRFDGLNSAQVLPQDTTSSYGKTILINLIDASSEIFSSGHRNPQGLTVDNSGNIWLTEHGPQGGDELNQIIRDTNYGWPHVTFGTDYGSFVWPLNEIQGSHHTYQAPVYSWGQGLGISAVIATRENLFPLWQHDLMISFLSAGEVIRARIQDGRIVNSEQIKIGRRIRALVETSNGTIVLWTDESTIITIDPAENVQLSEAERGRMLFAACAGCHAINDGKTHGIGPDLAGVVGRRIASASGYSYSGGLSGLSDDWSEEMLDAFLASPQTFAPGNLMIENVRISDQATRSAIIEFLKTQ